LSYQGILVYTVCHRNQHIFCDVVLARDTGIYSVSQKPTHILWRLSKGYWYIQCVTETTTYSATLS